MGAPRKTLAQHKAAGTYRRDRHGSWSEPTGVDTLPPPPPSTLTDLARAEWQRVIALLGTTGRLTSLDTALLTSYAELVAQLTEAPRDFTAAQHTALRLAASELGLTPTARTKIQEAEQPTEPSRWAQFS